MSRYTRLLSLRGKRIKAVSTLLVYLAVSGCAAPNYFGGIYNKAVRDGKTTTIVRQGQFEEIQAETLRQIRVSGYTRIWASDPKQGFLVLIKMQRFFSLKGLLTGDPTAARLILKFSNAGDNGDGTRIDLVNGSTMMLAIPEVEKDIQQIAARLANPQADQVDLHALH